MSSGFDRQIAGGMWRVVFHERRGYRVHLERTGPWLPSKKMAQQWAEWFGSMGHHVALQDQYGNLEKLYQGLPG